MVNTLCKGCGFASPDADLPGSCSLGLLAKFADSGAALSKEPDGDGRRWVTVEGRLCPYYCPSPAEGHAARVRGLVKTKFLVVVWVHPANDLLHLGGTLRSVATQPHPPAAVEIVTTPDARVAYRDVIGACEAAFGEALPWNVKLLPAGQDRGQAVDAAAAGHDPRDIAFYAAFDSGLELPPDLLGGVDRLLNDDLARFLYVARYGFAGLVAGPVVHLLTHRQVGGHAKAFVDTTDADGVVTSRPCDSVESKIWLALESSGSQSLALSFFGLLAKLGESCPTL